MDKTQSSRRPFLAVVVASVIGATFGFAATTAFAAPQPGSSVDVTDQSGCTPDTTVDQPESGQKLETATTEHPIFIHSGGRYAPTPQ